jgi:hypothetical protein
MSFPTGWPVRCPECSTTFLFTYKSDRTGNIRCYRCQKCGEKYVALWRHEPIESCLCEPTNTKMEDWEWHRVETEELDDPDIIDVEAKISSDEIVKIGDGR